jgi:hypothetical protein
LPTPSPACSSVAVRIVEQSNPIRVYFKPREPSIIHSIQRILKITETSSVYSKYNATIKPSSKIVVELRG